MSRTVLIGDEARALEARGVAVIPRRFTPAAPTPKVTVPQAKLSDYKAYKIYIIE